MVSFNYRPLITAELVTHDRRFASCNAPPTFLRPADVVQRNAVGLIVIREASRRDKVEVTRQG